MMFRALYVLFVMVASVACSNHSLTKRHLNWKDEQRYEIKSSSAEVGDIVVDHLTSHPENVKVLDNQVYISFVLYKRNGSLIETNGGVFHFINVNTANNLRMECTRPTPHAGAYRYFYGHCPEDDTLLVASGYCYQGMNGLVYNSGTFNLHQSYSDNRYYLGNGDKNARQVHVIEQHLLNKCYNDWKDSGFETQNWSCEFSDVSMVQFMAQVAVSEDATLDVCNTCDEPCPSSATSLFNHGNEIAGCVVMLLSISWNLILN